MIIILGSSNLTYVFSGCKCKDVFLRNSNEQVQDEYLWSEFGVGFSFQPLTGEQIILFLRELTILWT